MAGFRLRADSLGSLRGPPQNTPDTSSVAGDLSSLNLDAVEEDLTSKAADLPFGWPTLVPENTPTSTTLYRATLHDLPRIDEAIELLPPPLTHFSGSPPPSLAEDPGELGSIPIALGSPRKLPLQQTGSKNISSLVAAPQCQLTTPRLLPSQLDGVREHTDWHDDIEQDIERDLARLANLADDDFQRDPSCTAEQHYRQRLMALLNGPNRRYVMGELGTAAISTTAEAGSPLRTSTIGAYEFQQLKAKVEELVGLLNNVTQAQSKSEAEIVEMKSALAGLLTEHDTKAMQD